MKSVPWFTLTILMLVAAIISCGKKSTTPVCNDQPRAYSLGVLRETWIIASPPLDPVTLRPFPARGLFDPAFHWFNPYNQFRRSDVYDLKPGTAVNDRIHVLVLDFKPDQSRLRDSAGGPWGGIMHGFSRGAWDQTAMDILVLRMAIVGSPAGLGELHLDFGRISEDVNLNGGLDTEDKNNNGLVDPYEDVGLDGTPDSLEIGSDGRPYDPITNPDPAGDNWSYDPRRDQNDYSHLNGTQGDGLDGYRGWLPSTEDIGGSSSLDTLNSYFSLVLDLSDPARYGWSISGSRTSSDLTGYAQQLTWVTYWIPLWPSAARVAAPGSPAPDSTQIQFARLWIAKMPETVRLYIAQFDRVDLPLDDRNAFDRNP